MAYERLWERLLEFLARFGNVESRDGRLVVTPPRGSDLPRVEIVMTPKEWDDLVSIPFGDFASAAEYLRAEWAGLDADQPFLVYDQYALEASATPDLPPDPDEARLAELLRQHSKGFGRWYATNPDGSREYFRPEA